MGCSEKKGKKSSLTVPFIILMSDNWRNTLSEECVMRKCFIIDVCDQYANGVAKTSHSDWKGGGWEKSPVQGNGPRCITTLPTPTENASSRDLVWQERNKGFLPCDLSVFLAISISLQVSSQNSVDLDGHITSYEVLKTMIRRL